MNHVLPPSHKAKSAQFASLVSVAGFGSRPFVSGWIAQFYYSVRFALGQARNAKKPNRPSFKPFVCGLLGNHPAH